MKSAKSVSLSGGKGSRSLPHWPPPHGVVSRPPAPKRSPLMPAQVASRPVEGDRDRVWPLTLDQRSERHAEAVRGGCWVPVLGGQRRPTGPLEGEEAPIGQSGAVNEEEPFGHGYRCSGWPETIEA